MSNSATLFPTLAQSRNNSWLMPVNDKLHGQYFKPIQPPLSIETRNVTALIEGTRAGIRVAWVFASGLQHHIDLHRLAK
jgi:hypothetical protein